MCLAVDWWTLGDRSYHFSSDVIEFNEADEYCKGIGGNVLALETEAELHILTDFINSTYGRYLLHNLHYNLPTHAVHSFSVSPECRLK